MTRSLWWTCFILLSVALAGALGAYAVLRSGSGEEAALDVPPVLRLDPPRPLPDFELTDQHGRRVSREDLLGRVWVADFIFTCCVESCPAMTARMMRIQDELRKDPGLASRVRLVSFSVDPARDTPEKLRSYAGAHRAEDDVWIFLTGRSSAVADLSRKGFLLASGSEADGAQDGLPVPREMHSDRFVLVDHLGRVRGYYSASRSEEHLAQLLRDIRELAGEAREPSTS